MNTGILLSISGDNFVAKYKLFVTGKITKSITNRKTRYAKTTAR
jgi:hypothetical protein